MADWLNEIMSIYLYDRRPQPSKNQGALLFMCRRALTSRINCQVKKQGVDSVLHVCTKKGGGGRKRRKIMFV